MPIDPVDPAIDTVTTISAGYRRTCAPHGPDASERLRRVPLHLEAPYADGLVVKVVAPASLSRLRLPSRAWFAAFAAVPVLAALIWAGAGGDRTTTAIGNVAAIITAVGGGIVLLRAGRSAAGGPRAWLLLGLAMLLWGLGEVLWTWYEVVQGDEVPFPSIADVAYLAAVPFAMAGVLAFASGTGARFQVRTLLDGCLVAASFLFTSWALVLGPLWQDRGARPSSRWSASPTRCPTCCWPCWR